MPTPARVLLASSVVRARRVFDDDDVPDGVGAEVAVPEDQVAGAFLPGWDPGAASGGEPVALGAGGARQGHAGLPVGGLGEG